MYAQIITSSLTVGLGGSAGLESPIVVAGAALDQITQLTESNCWFVNSSI
jgi:H+/Cl- antiporter ClcA